MAITTIKYLSNTVGDSGSVSSPAANATVVSLPASSVPAGSYEVRIQIGYGATAGAVNNMWYGEGSTVVSRLYIPALANVVLPEIIFPRRTLTGLTGIGIAASASGAGDYLASIRVTKISTLGGVD